MSGNQANNADFDATRANRDIKDNVYYQQLQHSLIAKNKKARTQQIKKQQQQQVNKPKQIDIKDQVLLTSQSKSVFNWKQVNEKGKVDFELDFQNRDVFATSVLTSEKALGIISVLGIRIDMKNKMQGFITKYLKNYVQARSHNLMVSKFAQFNVAILGQMLSVMGMTTEEIHELQKKALETAEDENIQLFCENEYNSEMIDIVGGGTRKEVASQKKIISEMRTQFITQMQRLGNPNYYTDIRIKEIQIEQVKKILTAFHEEKTNMEFQLNYIS